jgi:dienelactone hydrolase
MRKNRMAALLAACVLLGAAASMAYAAPLPNGPFDFTAKAVSVPSRGVSIPAVLTLPVAEGKLPLVVIAHGHGGSKEENGGLTSIAESLAARGIASIRMDFPGCGESAEPFIQNNLTNMMADFAAARDYAMANAPIDAASVGAFGYSMGGRIAILSSGQGYKSLGLLAPLGNDGPNGMYAFMGGSEQYAALAAKAKADGHVLFTTPFGQKQDLSAKWFDDNAAAKGLAAISSFKGRILFVTGDADTIIPASVIQETAGAAKASAGIEIVQVAGADHGYGFYGGDSRLKAQTVEAVASFFALTLR